MVQRNFPESNHIIKNIKAENDGKSAVFSFLKEGINGYYYKLNTSIKFIIEDKDYGPWGYQTYSNVEYIITDLNEIEKFKNFLKNDDLKEELVLKSLRRVGDDHGTWIVKIYDNKYIKNFTIKEELVLEVFTTDLKKFIISDKESISKFLSEITIYPKELSDLRNEIKDLSSKIQELENAIKFAPLGQEYQKTQNHFDNLVAMNDLCNPEVN